MNPREVAVLSLAFTANLVLGVAGQLLLKLAMRRIVAKGAHHARTVLLEAALNPLIWLGVVCFLTSTACWLLILSKIDLSQAYPIAGASHICILLTSWLFLGETVNWRRWSGAMIILAGILVVIRS